MTKEEYFKTLIGKTVKISKTVNTGYNYIYFGILIEASDDGILINDCKAGPLLLSYDGLSVLKIEVL